jgi:protein-S-isoprenylcysteine O-methyltransferase Ste14
VVDALGLAGDPHVTVLHITSVLVIVGGFVLLARAWRVLYEAQRRDALATTGPYAYVRHPQYVAFIAIMTGFMFQWPTILTLGMFPLLVTMYVRLAHAEERDMRSRFGEQYTRYAARPPAWVADLRRPIGTRRAER